MRIPRPTFSSAIALLALFVALGGSSYAAITISGGNVRNGTLTGKDLKNESVKGADVDNGTLTAKDVKNGSLLAGDFKSGQLPAGPAGPQGAQGLQGPPGATNVVTRRSDVNLPGTSLRAGNVSCQPSETAVGGGVSIGGLLGGLGAVVLESAPIEADGTRPEDGDVSTGWGGAGLNQTPAPYTLNIFVLCASP